MKRVEVKISEVVERINELGIDTYFDVGEILIYRVGMYYQVQIIGKLMVYMIAMINNGKYKGYWEIGNIYYLRDYELVRFIEGIRGMIENVVFI